MSAPNDYLAREVTTAPRAPYGSGHLKTYWLTDGKQYVVDEDNNVTTIADQAKSIDNVPANNFVVYTPTIHTQGDTGADTRIKITATKPDGTAAALANHKLRVRVCNSGTHAESTNATLAVAEGTTELLDLGTTGDKDFLIQESSAATLTTALTGTNNDLVYTAVTGGTAGNDITVAYVDPGTASAALSVSTSGSAITVNLATNAGTAQVETATVTAAAGATEAGVLTVVVTAAGVTGSPLSIPVSLTTDDDTADKVATAIRAALTANAALSAVYTVGGTAAAVTLTRIATAANDATLNLAWGAYVAGISAVTSSTNTTAGVAPAITSTPNLIKTAIEASAAASALVTVALASGNDGDSAVTALAATNLSGGVDGDVFWLDLTDGEAETVQLRLGPPPFGGNAYGDYSATLNVTHAAP